MNIYIVGSPWHLIIAAALQSPPAPTASALFLIERISDASLRTMLEICSKLQLQYEIIGNIESVRFSGKNLKHPFGFIKKSRKEFEETKKKFSELTSNITNPEIFYFNIYSPITRAQLSLAIEKKMQLSRVEDGICDYFDFPLVEHPLLSRLAKNLFAKLFISNFYHSRETNKIQRSTKSYYLFFPKLVPGWNSQKIPLISSRDEIRATFSKLCKDSRREDKTNSILIIGQTLYEDKYTSLSEEIECYKHALKHERHAYFKPHPRSSQEKLKELKKLPHISVIETNISVEELIHLNRYKAVIGMWSNPIFYSPILFQTPTLSLLDTVNSNNRNFLRIKRELKNKLGKHINYVE